MKQTCTETADCTSMEVYIQLGHIREVHIGDEYDSTRYLAINHGPKGQQPLIDFCPFCGGPKE